jgi:hypothetical protein
MSNGVRHARDVLMDDDALPLPNIMVKRTGPGRPAAHHDRWADKRCAVGR